MRHVPSLHMSGEEARGRHVLLDYVGYSSPVPDDGKWMLAVMREAVQESGIREVHSHVVSFDGVESPPGFAAVVLIDESHVTAHCYSDSGLLAIDVFTCGKDSPEGVADYINSSLEAEAEGIRLISRESVPRFISGD